MKDKSVRHMLYVIVAAIIATGITLITGIGNLAGITGMILLWGTVVLDTTAVGFLISLGVMAFTKHDFRDLIMPTVPLIIIVILILQMIAESHTFMGNLGMGILFWFFIIPMIITFIIWTAVLIVKIIKRLKTVPQE